MNSLAFTYEMMLGRAHIADIDARATLNRDMSVDIEFYDYITGEFVPAGEYAGDARGFLYINCSDAWTEYRQDCFSGWRAADRVAARKRHF